MFIAWPKIKRPDNLHVVITEKMDGTNACIIKDKGKIVGVQSRSRLITVEDDNFGFARWVENNRVVLEGYLPDGYHYGEWVGPGIQKNPHNLHRKYFYLFNTNLYGLVERMEEVGIPIRCVKTLYKGSFNSLPSEKELLKDQPEGVVVYFSDFNSRIKITHNGQKPK